METETKYIEPVNQKYSDSTLLESAIAVLSSIANAKKFKDHEGDKMIMASYADLANAEIRLILTKRQL